MLSILNEGGNSSTVVFLDVGANIGSQTLPIAASGYEVWSVEPVKEPFSKVLRETRNNTKFIFLFC